MKIRYTSTQVAILASIIIIALRKILVQIFDLPKFWRLSRMDGVVWVIVFICVVIIDVDVGLGVGFCLSIGAVFMQGLKAYTCLLGNIPNTDLYLDINRYKAAREMKGIKIVHYRGGVNFATRTNLRAEVVKLVQLDPKTENNRRQKLIRKINKPQSEVGITNPGFMGDGMTEITVPNSQLQQNSVTMHSIVLDCSAMSNIDPAGASQIKTMADEFGHVDIKLYLAGMPTAAYEKMKKCGYAESEDCLPFFPTVFDAVHHIQNNSVRI